jgi:hypothetical protein
MDNVLMDYLINREMLEYIYDTVYEVFTEMMMRMAKAGVDMISSAATSRCRTGSSWDRTHGGKWTSRAWRNLSANAKR